MIVYIGGQNANELLNRVVELRLQNPLDSEYSVEFFGNYVPCFKIREGEIDRLFAYVPPSSGYTCMPLFVKEIQYKSLLFEYETFFFYIDAMHPQHLKNRSESGYYIDQTGFNINGGVVYVDSTEYPAKHKFLVNNSNFKAEFSLVDPINSLLKWSVRFDNKDVYINDTLIQTVAFNDGTEIDIGYDENLLQVTIYNSENSPTQIQNNTPLNSAFEYSDTNFQISGEDFEFKWWFCYRGAPESVTVLGATTYVDVFDISTYGIPLLVQKQYYGFKNEFSISENKKYSAILRVGELTNVTGFGSVTKFLLHKLFEACSKITLTENIQKDLLALAKMVQDKTGEFSCIMSLGELCEVLPMGIQNAFTELSQETQSFQTKLAFEQHISQKFDAILSVARQEIVNAGIKNTFQVDVATAAVIGIALAKETETDIISILEYAVAKSAEGVSVETWFNQWIHIIPDDISIRVVSS